MGNNKIILNKTKAINLLNKIKELIIIYEIFNI